MDDILHSSKEMIITKPTKVIVPADVDKDFMDCLSDVIQEYGQTLKGLKDR